MPRVSAIIELRGETTVELEVDAAEPRDSDILSAAYAQTVLPSIGSEYGEVLWWEVVGDER